MMMSLNQHEEITLRKCAKDLQNPKSCVDAQTTKHGPEIKREREREREREIERD